MTDKAIFGKTWGLLNLESDAHTAMVVANLRPDGRVLVWQSPPESQGYPLPVCLGAAQPKEVPVTFKVGDWIEYKNATTGKLTTVRLVAPMGFVEPRIGILSNDGCRVSPWYPVRNVNKISEDEMKYYFGSEVQHVSPTG